MGARGVLLLAAAVVGASVGLAGSETHVLRRPELATVDARFDVRGKQAPHPDVVLVGLDARSLELLEAQPPIPRRLHAQLIDRLREGGARTIAYDFQFQGQTTVRDDNALFRAVDRAGGLVVLGETIVGPGPQTPLDGIAEATGAIVASTNFPERSARGGPIRRLPSDELGLPHFAVAAAGADVVPRGVFDGDGAWIDFAGPAGTIPHLSFIDVLENGADVRDKIVVVGAIDPILQDIHPTAAGDNVPGAEINANAVATILDDFPLRDPPGWLAFLLIAGMGAAVPLAALPLRGLRWLPLPLILGGGYLVAAQLAFDAGTVLPVAAPLVALLVGSLDALAVAYITDVRERRRLRASFARFVPADVVGQLADRGRLPGEELEATVLFADLRGFTTMAEAMRAADVIALLDRHLGAMSDAILDHGGTVVSYMGDGIMAVFGAPLPLADHADRAVAAARDMLAAAGELPMGIGICSGPVMSGTVGSERRMEYAAVGDTTNTAARLEAMTKEQGVPLLLADTTKAALRDGEGGLRCVGDLEVRGRGATVRAWTLNP